MQSFTLPHTSDVVSALTCEYVSMTAEYCWMLSRMVQKRLATPRRLRAALALSSSAVKVRTSISRGTLLRASNCAFRSSLRLAWNSYTADERAFELDNLSGMNISLMQLRATIDN